MAGRSTNIAFHIVGWLLMMGLFAGFMGAMSSGTNLIGTILSPYFILFFAIYSFIFYFNKQLLLNLYFQKKYLIYFSSIIILLIIIYFIKPFELLLHNDSHGPPLPPPGPDRGDRGGPPGEGSIYHPDITSITVFMMAWSLGTALEVIKRLRISKQETAAAETEKVNAELSFLKAQINPHFLFNTLNNIYSLVVLKDEQAPESVMKLSNIMRYFTDGVATQMVPLQSEIDCATDYIDLQRLRINKKVSIEYSVEGDFSGLQIPPLVMMTFIENAFKHGTSSSEPCAIRIRINAEGTTISLFCENRLFKRLRTDERTGIGILNTRQRLEHLYPGSYQLNISEQNEYHTVRLKLQTNK